VHLAVPVACEGVCVDEEIRGPVQRDGGANCNISGSGWRIGSGALSAEGCTVALDNGTLHKFVGRLDYSMV
jgi:hypothetical protein